MTKESEANLLQLASNPKQELTVRLRALDELGTSADPALVPQLKALLNRPRPPHEDIENWDPVAAERVVDFHVLQALHRLGDDSEIRRLAELVRQAGTTLQGPYDERQQAVAALLAIARVEPVGEVVRVSSDPAPLAVRNSVQVLERLSLPEAPTGQEIAHIQSLARVPAFTITRLKEEMDAIVNLSGHTVELSSGARAFVEQNDYSRGKVERRDMSLADIVQRDVRLLGFSYFVQTNQVIICTIPEAAARWQSWWQNYGRRLEFRLQAGRFMLKQ